MLTWVKQLANDSL